MKKDSIPPLLKFTYTIDASNYAEGPDRFINKINLKIETDPDGMDDDNPIEPEVIGYGKISQILIDTMEDFKLPVRQILDDDNMFLNEIVGSVYDFEEWCFRPDVMEAEGDMTRNICFIEYVALKQTFRRCGIGREVFNDIIIRFGSNSGLILLSVTPFQFFERFDWDIPDNISEEINKGLPDN